VLRTGNALTAQHQDRLRRAEAPLQNLEEPGRGALRARPEPPSDFEALRSAAVAFFKARDGAPDGELIALLSKAAGGDAGSRALEPAGEAKSPAAAKGREGAR
jgi:hypothetical protein